MQNPILGFAPHDIVALATRLRPFLGQIGTSPSTTIPDSHNAGDFGSFLIGAPHRYALDAQELQRHKTDGHMDIDAVRAGRDPRLPGQARRRRRLPRRHARAPGRRRDRRPHLRRVRHRHAAGRGAQGRWAIDGPILFPLAEDLPFLARPLSGDGARAGPGARAAGTAWRRSRSRCRSRWSAPGPDLNSATDNGLARAAELLDLTVPEVKNRATIAGAIEIGRHPGVVQVTFRAPAERLEARGLLGYAVEQYGGCPA